MSVVYDIACRAFDRDADRTIRFEWDGWRSTFYFYHVDVDLSPQLDLLSDPAVAALSLGAVEWICARFWWDPATRDVMQFVNAAWGMQLSAASCEWIEFDDEEWQGPIRGPLRSAQLIALDTVFCKTQNDSLFKRACWACNLARHVIGEPERERFTSWLEQSLHRLQQHHPYEVPVAASIFDEAFPAPAPVAPPAVCPDLPYDPADIQRYVREQMTRIGADNPYSSPD